MEIRIYDFPTHFYLATFIIIVIMRALLCTLTSTRSFFIPLCYITRGESVTYFRNQNSYTFYEYLTGCIFCESINKKKSGLIKFPRRERCELWLTSIFVMMPDFYLRLKRHPLLKVRAKRHTLLTVLATYKGWAIKKSSHIKRVKAAL